MKKSIWLSGMACSVAVIGAGCAMCSTPIPHDPTCIEETHLSDTTVKPLSLRKVTPWVVESNRQFRPVYRAGSKVFGVGTGLSEDEAVADAVAKIMESQKCEYLVAVNHITTSKTHPTWRFFSTTNYSVRISGIPIFLERLEEEDINPKEVAVSGCNCNPQASAGNAADGSNGSSNGSNNGSNNGQTTVVMPPPVVVGAQNGPVALPRPPMALIRLTDIKVDVTAKGVASDDAGVIFPVK